MLTDIIFDALERRGADRYMLATWRARVLSRHHQAVLEAVVIAIAFVLVMLLAATAATAQTAAEPAMKHRCAEKHEEGDKNVQALKKTITDARLSNDLATLRNALDATLRHLDGMAAQAEKCARMMTDEAAKAPVKAPEPAKHDH